MAGRELAVQQARRLVQYSVREQEAAKQTAERLKLAEADAEKRTQHALCFALCDWLCDMVRWLTFMVDVLMLILNRLKIIIIVLITKIIWFKMILFIIMIFKLKH